MAAIDQTHQAPVQQDQVPGIRQIGRFAGLLTAVVLVFASLYYLVLYIATD